MKEMPRTSTYWFVDPDYTSQEAESMLAHIDPGIYSEFSLRSPLFNVT